MNLKCSIIHLALASALVFSQAIAAPILEKDPMTAEMRIENSNAWIEIDDAALRRNITRLQAKLSEGTKLCAVIKSDVYGHGLSLLIPTFIDTHVPCLGFTSNEEARIARDLGFDGTLMRIRTATPNEIKHAIDYKVEELVGNLELAKKVSKIATEASTIIPIHFAINANGLARNGIDLTTDNGKKDALTLAKLHGISIVGLMTHYPLEEVEDIKRNLTIFKEQAQWLIDEAGLNRADLTLHTANTFTTLNVPEAHLDAVRVASALVGYDSDEFEDLLTFKTSVAGINSYKQGVTVGYDRTFILERDSRLANLPIGYSDGYHAAFGNKGHVLINGHRVLVIGKVSMNTTMVDITDFPDIRVGDEVVLFGKQGNVEVTEAEVEKIIGALLVDAYTRWGNSNPKVLAVKSANAPLSPDSEEAASQN